ncbi:hypothetical protein ECG_03178 [Echinococcus granulosus]|uniref:Uncharacterized protein n=1 Tax=Echinococcus granulosus TaxID=6210 RepID=A0A068WQC4_ECHGR|nr:hypothetical protein ECG_03178 [Echinococcus granulosus]CDS19850.1 hypothetical protein EgrG_000202100 [Echinococcus granulosus]
MIELSSSWELQGRRKLSDILFIKEVQLDDQCCGDEDTGGDLVVDVSCEFASKPVILQPYLHPEVSSAGPCCIMIRLSTQRLLRIVQLVLISSSPHIDFVDRYGEALARIGGVAVPGSESLFRCSSGRLSPHTECVVRFSEVHHLDPLVIQHIGVYTVCPISSLSFTEPSESHTQEIIKLSSFLGSSPHQPIAPVRSDPQTNNLRLYKSTTTTPMPTVEPQREKSASSPAAISAGKEVIAAMDEHLYTLCSQFLTSLNQTQQSPEFWQKCATSLLASLVQLCVGEFVSERRQQDFFQQMRGILGGTTSERQREQQQREAGDQEAEQQQRQEQHRCLRSSSQSTMFPHSGVSSASTISSFSHSCSRPDESVSFSICTLSASLDEIRQSTTTQLDEIFKRLSCLEENRKAGDQ